MKIKRIKKLRVNNFIFYVKWAKDEYGGRFSYADKELVIGCKDEWQILEIILHELQEICALSLHVRFPRPDVDSDYLFCYDHRQHTAMMEMLAGLLEQFLD